MAVSEAVIREHVETDLGDKALKRLIDDAKATVAERAGRQGQQTVLVDGGHRFLLLDRPITKPDDIAEIKEVWPQSETVLTADDWRWRGGRRLERIHNGFPAWWGGIVEVTYTPARHEERRDRAVIDLVRLAIQYSALERERAGDYESWPREYQQERERILRELTPPLVSA